MAEYSRGEALSLLHISPFHTRKPLEIYFHQTAEPSERQLGRENLTVSCFLAIVDVGLKATFITISSPLEMPPWMPPERLVVVRVCRTQRSRAAAAVNWPPFDQAEKKGELAN